MEPGKDHNETFEVNDELKEDITENIHNMDVVDDLTVSEIVAVQLNWTGKQEVDVGATDVTVSDTVIVPLERTGKGDVDVEVAAADTVIVPLERTVKCDVDVVVAVANTVTAPLDGSGKRDVDGDVTAADTVIVPLEGTGKRDVDVDVAVADTVTAPLDGYCKRDVDVDVTGADTGTVLLDGTCKRDVDVDATVADTVNVRLDGTGKRDVDVNVTETDIVTDPLNDNGKLKVDDDIEDIVTVPFNMDGKQGFHDEIEVENKHTVLVDNGIGERDVNDHSQIIDTVTASLGSNNNESGDEEFDNEVTVSLNTEEANMYVDGKQSNHNKKVGISQRIRNHLRFENEYHKRNFLQTMCVCLTFALLGWTYGQLGTAFADIQLILNTNVEETSLVFTMNSIGYMAGSLGIGYIYDRVDTLLLLGIITILNGIASAVMPWCTIYGGFMAIRVAGGFLSGGIDCGGNAKVASSWGTEGRQYMQAIHFAYAFGGIISPLVTSYFLAPRLYSSPISNATMNLDDVPLNYTNVYQTNDWFNATVTMLKNQSNGSNAPDNGDLLIQYGETNVQTAFVITGVLCVISGSLFIILYLKGFEKTPPFTRSSEKTTNQIDVKNRVKLTVSQKTVFVIFMAIAVIFYAAVECKIQSFLMPFVLMQLKWTKTDGAFLISLLWTFFAIGRFGGITISKFFAPHTLVISFFSMAIISFLGMFIGAVLKIDLLIWILIPLSGLSISIMYPTFLVWTDENAIRLSGKFVGFFCFTGAVGFIIDPLYVGALMENVSPMYFIYLQIGQSGISLAAFVLLLLGVTYIRKRPVIGKRAV